MGKIKENPRYNVVSMRVSDYELKRLTSALDDGESISDLCRDGALVIATLRLTPSRLTTRTVPI